jgi:nicotinic acid phosphoribosyltransferase
MKTMRDLSVKSPLDVDFYKYTMAYFVWKYFPDVIVKYKFKNRTKGINLLHLQYSVRRELDEIKTFYKYTEEELEYIKSLNVFPEEFIRFLALVELPEIKVYKDDDGELAIETEGVWKHSIWWETMVLSNVNNLCYKDLGILTGKDYKAIGNENITKKIDILKQNPKFTIEVGGHTDSRGNKELNKKISQDRANRVKEILESFGVDKDRIKAVGYGNERPIAQDDENGLSEINRRVEFIIGD